MIDMRSLHLRIGSRKFLCDAAELAPTLRTQFSAVAYRGQAKIAGTKECHGRLFTMDRHAAKGTELRFTHMFLQLREHRRCHRAQTLHMHFVRDVSSDD